MHILLVNDDGPPSNQHSPYIHTFVLTLQKAGHLVSVVLPHVQRSWIGKAHMIGQILTPSYYRPGPLHEDNGIESPHPFNDGKEEWILIDGTPASCAQVGLYHLFKDRPPIDVLVSGPNYGRNTTALFGLSSGTIGAALEGSMSGKKSIALSFAFDKKIGDRIPEHIAGASELSTRLIEKLVNEWPEDVHLYNINVPLEKGANPEKIVYTEMLQNQWNGSTFQEILEDAEDVDPGEEEKKIREGEVNGEIENVKPKQRRIRYKWAPRFSDVWESSMKAGYGDGWTVHQGCVSVTPLRANFWALPRFKGEIKLEEQDHNSLTSSMPKAYHGKIYGVINYPDDYVQPLILWALKSVFQASIQFLEFRGELPTPSSALLQWTAYEDLDFEHAMQNPQTSLICSYVIRKALIRKHYLSNTISTWVVKHPQSILASHFKPCVHFELDYAEFLDDALVDAWDLNESLARNENASNMTIQWWILKPGMSDGGNGIRLFSSMNQLREIFEEWEPDDEIEAATELQEQRDDSANREMITSQLRHFIAQPYIGRPLLLSTVGNRKFHLRAYVLAVGSLKVYVYRDLLALFAANPYQDPSSSMSNQMIDLTRHLTNTCLQSDTTKENSVHRFWSLEEKSLPHDWKNQIFRQICDLTGEVFEAAARSQMVHFQTIPNSFEIFGVDFLVDRELQVWLLELNAYPDFRQTGQAAKNVVGGLLQQAVEVAVRPFFQPTSPRCGNDQMLLVREISLGR